MTKKTIWCLAAMLILSLSACKKTDTNQQPPAQPAATEANAENANAPAADAAQPGAANPADAAANPADDQQAQDLNAEIQKQLQMQMPQQIPAPDDVAAPPEDAIKTASGLAYKKLVTNDAGRSIAEDDIVKLHYTGWTTDGKMFDSSMNSGQPATFVPTGLIPGMKEGLTLSKTGEKVRVWIPQNLAYDGAPGVPQGMLVFDFEILDVLTPTMPPKDIPEDATKFEVEYHAPADPANADAAPAAPTKVEVAYRISKSNPGGKELKENDFVSIDFAGWTQADGKRFHSSLETGEPLSAPINAMFPGWREVLPKAHVGETIQMWLPQEIGIDPTGEELKGTLIFEVTINSSIEMPQTPEDVAAPPADAEKTESGIASKVLQPGTGAIHPKADSFVKVNYSGWTTDGAMFDSSIPHGQPIEFPLSHVIPGWTEGVQLMVVGEKRRFWIPEELAYKGQPGAPQGMLVFDVELLDIKDPPAMPPMHDHDHDHGQVPPPPADAPAPAPAP